MVKLVLVCLLIWASYTRLRIFGCKQRAVWCSVVQPNCSCTFPPLPTMATVLALTLAPFLHYFPISFHQNGPSQKLSSPTQQLSKKLELLLLSFYPTWLQVSSRNRLQCFTRRALPSPTSASGSTQIWRWPSTLDRIVFLQINMCQVASERNDREQFLRSGVNPGYEGIRQNGTYSSHPNLPTFDPQTHPSQLPAFPPIEPPAMQKMAPLPRPPVR